MDPNAAESAQSLLPLLGLTANELAFALFLVGLVYLAVSLPAIGRVLARFGRASRGDGA
jgi:hypothetical protein